MLIVTDTYEQVNGVSNTYKNLLKISKEKIDIIHPGQFKWRPSPLYPEVQLCTEPLKVYKHIKGLKPKHIHIATEGMLGLMARIYCERHSVPYTTSFHTKFPEFLKKIAHIPECITYSYERWFHKHSQTILVPTQGMKEELEENGFENQIDVWTRGVAKELIAPKRTATKDPVRLLSVGRVSKEKSLDEVCMLSDKYHITVVGDGPYKQTLEGRYPKVDFVGYKFGEELAKIYADHDVFVFPSRTDTFGIVMIESLCNGTPVAAYDVTGPKDVIQNGITGYLGNDLEENIRLCLELDCAKIKRSAVKEWSWEKALDIFLNSINQDHKS